MYINKFILFITFVFLAAYQTFSQSIHINNYRQNLEQPDLIIGADISQLAKVEDYGGVFKVNRVEKDALIILKNHWFQYMRLNIFHTPDDKYMQLETNLQMAQRIKNSGLKLLLDLHYSDTWANPGVQTKPEVWQNLSFDVLKDSVYQYTHNIITIFKNYNALPDMVQIGNEINGGLLWDDGHVGGIYDTPEQWQKLAALINEGIRGVKNAIDPGDTVQIMIHPAGGESKENIQWFFDNLFAQGVDFDIIGLSFYPYWNGRLDGLEDNLTTISPKYGKDIIVVETSYPWTLEEYDEVPTWVEDPERLLHPGYPASVLGQQAFLEDIIKILNNIPTGKGLFYWQPIDISAPQCGAGSENLAMFDFQGVLLPSVKAFAPPGIAQIKMNLNIAAIPDTLSGNSLFELRGSLDYNYPVALSDGNILEWSEKSEIEFVHQEGDNFSAIFHAPVGSILHCKLWSQDVTNSGLSNGWEVGDSNGDEYGNTVISVPGDTTLPVHFFNCSEVKKPYNWRLWEPGRDSVAVWFRVYMNTLEGRKDGYVPEDENLAIGIRGDNLYGSGPLDWDLTKILLKRELNDKNFAGFHIFSGAAFYPLSLAGQTQKYKLFIEPNGWEEGNLTDDRYFVIPGQDTTLHWVYYGNTAPITDGPSRITLLLNTATIPDTIGTDALFEVRGEINGTAPYTLPDGNIIDWNENSTLELKNIDGDYYEISFLVPDSAELRFKFWSRDAERLGLNDGWDIGDSNGDAYDNTILNVFTNMTLPLHFFNCNGEAKPYEWRPWLPKDDTIAVWFRAYMNTDEGIQDGYNPAAENQVIGVRGGNLLGWIKTLDWSVTNVTLHCESDNEAISGFHLFSGIAYFPKLNILNPEQAYKFFIEPNSWEEGNLTDDRKFLIPDHDTTLHWIYYGHTTPIQSGGLKSDGNGKLQANFLLRDNYPNPFNLHTVIHYEIPNVVDVKLEIYNLIGQRVKSFIYHNQPAGSYNVTWNGSTSEGLTVSSGIYLYRFQAGDFAKTKKMLVIK